MASSSTNSSNSLLGNDGNKNNENSESEINSDNYLFVAALDIGTTYSGYAFSSRDDFKSQPLLINMNTVWGSSGSSITSLKTPTSIIISKKKGKYVDFGYDAEDKFQQAMTDGQCEDLMFFQRFKMKLHNKTGIAKDLMIKDVAGRNYPAQIVFSQYIKALVDHVKERLKDFIPQDIEDNDIKWVLTVPAIWNDAAKRYMRKCANEAGIPDEMLHLALEPEAASIYLQYLSIEKHQDGLAAPKEGTKYMVVDIGGGTADITVHEKVSEGKLRELHHATGGACGGTAVDAAFESRLIDILGEKVMNTFRKKKTMTYLEIFRAFESVKRKLNPESTGSFQILFAYEDLEEICKQEENKTLEELFKGVEGMHLKGSRLSIDVKTMNQFFEPSTNELVNYIKSVLEKPQTSGISRIFLVGGSADSKIVQFKVKNVLKFEKVIVPPDAQLVVLKGAVLFGHCPTIIKSRILRFSYGTKVCKEFDPKVHKEVKKITVDGVDLCKDCFDVILKAGTEVEIGQMKAEVYSTGSLFQLAAEVEVFCSPLEDVQYIDDDKCFKLGELFVPLPGNLVADLLLGPRNHPFVVIYIFGNTELKVMAKDPLSGKLTSCSFDMNTDDEKQNVSQTIEKEINGNT